MSPTATEVTTESAAVPTTDANIYSRPSEADVTKAIMNELPDCTHEAALEFLDFMRQAVGIADTTGEPYGLSDDEAGGPTHHILNVVMPDGATAVPGSAHDLLQQLFSPKEGVRLLTHGRGTRFFEGDMCQIVVVVITSQIIDG